MEKFDIENFPTSESAKKMLSYVTEGFYDKSYVGKWLYQVMGLEYDAALKIAEELPYQFFPETATWGLMYHEIKWGLPVRKNLSYEERRRLVYQKRDNRAPITPYRMEKTLKDITGFDVRIADINDPGDYGFVALHPNVFKAYFMGEGTLDSKKAHEALDKLKQSHTTYTVNDRTEIVVDSSNLEKMILRKVIFKAQLLFWDCYVFNGEWNLDGSINLDAHRRYNLVLGFKYLMVDIPNQMAVELVRELFKTKAYTEESSDVSKVSNRFAISFWNIRMYDGTWLLDGSQRLWEYRNYDLQIAMKNYLHGAEIDEQVRASVAMNYNLQTETAAEAGVKSLLFVDFWRTLYLDGEVLLNGQNILNNSRGRMKAAISTLLSLDNSEQEQLETAVVTKTRDYWFFDGELTLNGSRNLNSIYRKETVE